MVNFISGIESTSAALNAERIRMEVISQNIANLNTTRSIDGRPYQRQHVVFETLLRQNATGAGPQPQGVQVSRIENDTRPPRLIYQPGHPDADGNGMVAVPDISLHEEMADMIASSRAFEANLAVVKNARQLAIQTLNIGKRS